MLHTIRIKDVVIQNVFLVVDSSFFTFFIISTRLRQKIIANIGIKTAPKITRSINIDLFHLQINTIFNIFYHNFLDISKKIHSDIQLACILKKIQRSFLFM